MGYFYGTGRRKCAVARVRISEGTGKFIINGKEMADFCRLDSVERVLLAPMTVTDKYGKIDVDATTSGGGLMGQAGAISLGLARALQKMDIELRKLLKPAGLLTRDGRKKERKKPGQPGARKRFQYSKR